MKKILVIGSTGQIGSELTLALRKEFGGENVIAGIRKTAPSKQILETGPCEVVDATIREQIERAVEKHDIDTIVHMAAILSAVGEQNPMMAWNVNMNGLINVLECARDRKMDRVLVPSSIAVFGPGTPLDNTPQETILRPTTMYGITKVAGELLGDYYVLKYGLDVRGLRYPGIISHETLPGGGTTDYAVAIYYEAVKNKKYTCFVREDTRLPMMYMPDCLKATISLLKADFNKLRHHCDFNVSAMSFSVKELADSIKKYIPEFEVSYEPDFRQKIADSWPNSIDDSYAREEWGWKPDYDLDAMTRDMLSALQRKHQQGFI
ncbi:MAG TPA: NAD-dependent epimerase/dehydratase family protein [Bacteroidales bacterium]|jgi:nucleoside-diphosphate-sugar epimerase|nr:NAD-dependent epimerase/dehydratase family protein [Bacteroidales bacterium]MBP9587904.1 NAD-dependent epimerase/dehydratase family protein [Bacteroidales bacterium]HOE58641.1 NAD-dependent epimerase/dehydratase family protein [Bacteroidales bacterium]HOR04425.1 NAD-dependent epimerase/dehydratase family protein [Bacteroidales bacterium]HOU34211.1 NAD-dependent epimerase/dehydratase family protein [Bacteroidales bacterium]